MEDKYVYCGVVPMFNEQIPYSYISDSGEIGVGNFVLIPYGKDDTEIVGKVISCNVYDANEVPFPIENTKHIIKVLEIEQLSEFDNFDMYKDQILDDINFVDDLIGQQQWDDVFDWACRHHETSNLIIANKVMQCYQYCIQQNMSVAALNLGTFYYNGIFVAQDYQKAFQLYKIAADDGISQAISNCGYCYYYGRHQQVDYKKAYDYFSIGALVHNNVECIYKLGDMYLNGYYVDKNLRYAFLLYQKAYEVCDDEQSNADCQFRLGKCYVNGTGTNVDIEKAYDYLSKALVNFYRRRKTDPFVSDLIASCKQYMQQCQDYLDKQVISTNN